MNNTTITIAVLAAAALVYVVATRTQLPPRAWAEQGASAPLPTGSNMKAPGPFDNFGPRVPGKTLPPSSSGGGMGGTVVKINKAVQTGKAIYTTGKSIYDTIKKFW